MEPENENRGDVLVREPDPELTAALESHKRRQEHDARNIDDLTRALRESLGARCIGELVPAPREGEEVSAEPVPLERIVAADIYRRCLAMFKVPVDASQAALEGGLAVETASLRIIPGTDPRSSIGYMVSAKQPDGTWHPIATVQRLKLELDVDLPIPRISLEYVELFRDRSPLTQ